MALNWQAALGGGAAGAAGGALSGSAVPGVGTAIGAGIGGAGGFISGLLSGKNDPNETWWEWLTGTPAGRQQWSQFSPEDQAVLTQARDQAMQQLKNPYEGFEPIRQNALNTFFQDIVPGLQHQFSASGQNGLGSGVLQTNLSSAGGRFGQGLAAMQSQYGQQNKENALRQLGLGVQRQENMYQQGGPGAFQSFLDKLPPDVLDKVFKAYGASNTAATPAAGAETQPVNPVGQTRFSSSSNPLSVNNAIDYAAPGAPAYKPIDYRNYNTAGASPFASPAIKQLYSPGQYV